MAGGAVVAGGIETTAIIKKLIEVVLGLTGCYVASKMDASNTGRSEEGGQATEGGNGSIPDKAKDIASQKV